MARDSEIPGLTEYLTRLAGQDEVLARVDRETQALPNAQIQSRPDQGALLALLVRLTRGLAAVEVGTFTGYGAICIARGLAEGGRLTCFEVCNSTATRLENIFGPTPCRSIRYCDSCRQPFEQFKTI